MNATKHKNTQLIHAVNAILLPICAVLAYFEARRGVQFAALAGVTWLAILLIVPRLLHVARLQKYNPQLTLIAEQSKYVGLWTAAWFAIHAGFALARHATPSFSPNFLVQPQIILGTLSLVVLLVLAALSNNWSYANVKWWKHISMLAWALPFMVIAHAFLASNKYMAGQILLVSPILLYLAAFSGYGTLFTKHRDYFFWWRPLLLTAGGILAALVAFWAFSA